MSLFEVDKGSQEKLKKKYENFTFEGTEFTLSKTQIRVQIDSKIYKDFLNYSESEAHEYFEKLLIMFIKTCYDCKIQLNPLNLEFIADDEINRSLQSVFEDKDGVRCGHILFPKQHLTRYVFELNFWHELGHCWISTVKPNNPIELKSFELNTDIIAICTLNKILPSHKRLYKDLVKLFTYFGGDEGIKYFGKTNHKNIMDNPELYLRNLVESKSSKST